MKRTYLLTAVYAIVLFLGFTGCSDDEPKITNTITLDGSSFKISTASLLGVSIDGEGHIGITFSNGSVTGTYSELTIDIEYFTNQPITGTYSFPQGNDRYLDDYLTGYSTYVNGNFNSTELSSGTVTVTENGGKNYTVTMDLTMLDGTKFKGMYKGNFIAEFNNQ